MPVEMETLLLLGNDRISRRAYSTLNLDADRITVVVDKVPTLPRLIRLLRSRRLSISLLVKMLISEIKRPQYPEPKGCAHISSNSDLMALIQKLKPAQVLMFRAGLIISREVIETGIPILNIHCALVPEYGGIGSIGRALRDRAFEQAACLHVVTTTIDEGQVLDREPYRLVGTNGYSDNENTAYSAGIVLLSRVLATSVRRTHEMLTRRCVI